MLFLDPEVELKNPQHKGPIGEGLQQSINIFDVMSVFCGVFCAREKSSYAM